MKFRLLKAAPIAVAIVFLLPGSANAATPFPPVGAGGAAADGSVSWSNRSVQVSGVASYAGTGCDAAVAFTFYLDEVPQQTWGNGVYLPYCHALGFNFPYSGPQGGIRAVRMCVYDYEKNTSDCADVFRSQDTSTGLEGNVPDLPAVTVGQ